MFVKHKNLEISCPFKVAAISSLTFDFNEYCQALNSFNKRKNLLILEHLFHKKWISFVF